jgi:hypothetical protein
MIAALFCDPRGCYANLPGVDLWDEKRDARLYAGPWPVVAHPPCSRWCQLSYINQKRYGHKIGDDGGCFASALASVRKWGGVLEHPARSYAWAAHGLSRPPRAGWQRVGDGWVCEVSQANYGHRARKLTWLYAAGASLLPSCNWSSPVASNQVSDLGRNRITAQISFCGNHGNSRLPRMSKREASATPAAFRDILISIDESCQPKVLAPGHGFNSERSQRAENGGRP